MPFARYASAAVSCLGAVFAIAPAQADVFDFSFGASSCVNKPTSPCAFGTFTTGAAAADPGFELITGLTFSVLKGEDDGDNAFSFTDVAGEDFQPGAAFNPATDAFISHTDGGATNNIGRFQLPEVSLFIDGESFAQLSGGLLGVFPDEHDFFEIVGALSIMPKTMPSPVPEASTWAMLLLGFGGFGVVAGRRRLGAALWPNLEG